MALRHALLLALLLHHGTSRTAAGAAAAVLGTPVPAPAPAAAGAGCSTTSWTTSRPAPRSSTMPSGLGRRPLPFSSSTTSAGQGPRGRGLGRVPAPPPPPSTPSKSLIHGRAGHGLRPPDWAGLAVWDPGGVPVLLSTPFESHCITDLVSLPLVTPGITVDSGDLAPAAAGVAEAALASTPLRSSMALRRSTGSLLPGHLGRGSTALASQPFDEAKEESTAGTGSSEILSKHALLNVDCSRDIPRTQPAGAPAGWPRPTQKNIPPTAKSEKTAAAMLRVPSTVFLAATLTVVTHSSAPTPGKGGGATRSDLLAAAAAPVRRRSCQVSLAPPITRHRQRLLLLAVFH